LRPEDSPVRKILVVDDDERLRSLLAEYLGSRGFDVQTVADGETCLDQLRTGGVDLVVLDLMLPGIGGLDVCRELRKFSQTPVIMLTARGDETDRIVGLEIGADDYLPKPFNPRELLARIEAVLRRTETAAGDDEREIVRAGPIEVDVDRRVATVDGEALDLTTTEFEILRILAANAGRVIARDRIMGLARGSEWASFERSVDVHISHLRKKLGNPDFIKTVRGVGYTMPKDPG
jgi:DNA-binding response OmpR family regulator